MWQCGHACVCVAGGGRLAVGRAGRMQAGGTHPTGSHTCLPKECLQYLTTNLFTCVAALSLIWFGLLNTITFEMLKRRSITSHTPDALHGVSNQMSSEAIVFTDRIRQCIT